jgi:hypothetical protein
MQNINILQLQGASDNEYEWSNYAVYADYDEAVAALAAINAEYDAGFTVYTLNENARIQAHTVVDNMWGL